MLFIIFYITSGDSFGLEYIPSESELFRATQKCVSGSFGIIPNQSEKRFVSRLMKKGLIQIDSG